MTVAKADQKSPRHALLADLDAAAPATGAPTWIAEVRRRAIEHLDGRPLPSKRDEAWRFTSVADLLSIPFSSNDGDSSPASRPAPGTALIAGGRFFGPTAEGWRGAGCSITSLAAAMAETGGASANGTTAGRTTADGEGGVACYLARTTASGFFADLNTARFTDGAFVRVEAGARPADPLEIRYEGGATATREPDAGPRATYPRTLVVVGAGARLTLFEAFVGAGGGTAALSNSVTEIFVEEGAHLEHVRLVEGSQTTHHIGQVAVELAKDARYHSLVLTLGGRLSRLDLSAAMLGEGATCRLDGIYTAGADERVDHHTLIDHAVPRCSSSQTYRGLAHGDGRAVFDGTARVRRDAQKSSAHQSNRNLLLSRDAIIHTKPHLEIDADDVSCSHGATVGALDDEQMFYLRSRGIDATTAQAMITFGFFRSLVDDLADEPLQRRLLRAILAHLPHGDRIGEIP